MTVEQDVNEVVAEKVMGWRLENRWWKGSWTLIQEDSFQPFTVLTDAWQVVEKFRSDGWDFNLYWEKNFGLWIAEFNKDEGRVYGGNGVTAPMAICLAAMDVVGTDI